MGVWIIGCLEDQTAGVKGNGETVVSKKCSLCSRSWYLWIKQVFLWEYFSFLSCTEHLDISGTSHGPEREHACTYNQVTRCYGVNIAPCFLTFVSPRPPCLSGALSLFLPHTLHISLLDVKCRNKSFTYWMYSVFSTTLSSEEPALL